MGEIAEITPQILFGKVAHKRLIPKVNAFTYGIYYLALPLSELSKTPISRKRFAPMSFDERKHGPYDGSSLKGWAREILSDYGITKADGEIVLICMPRIFGYVFNPVSFWLCLDTSQKLRAVICEVRNTFGEQHNYLCAHPDQKPIGKDDVLEARKLFHVSPFIQREGEYHFRFDYDPAKGFSAWIDLHDENGEKRLITWLGGDFSPLNTRTKRRAFWGYPLVTLKAITLIHWQALKLVSKGISYVPRPKQLAEKLSATKNISKK